MIGKPADMQGSGRNVATAERTSSRSLHGRIHLPPGRKSGGNFLREIHAYIFRRLTSNAIRDYLAKINPLDKAGAYAAQGAGAEIIDRIDGSFTNVVGLPMERTVVELSHFGIEPHST